MEGAQLLSSAATDPYGFRCGGAAKDAEPIAERAAGSHTHTEDRGRRGGRSLVTRHLGCTIATTNSAPSIMYFKGRRNTF